MKTTLFAAGGGLLNHIAISKEAFAASRGVAQMEYVTLNNGVRMPMLGYGTLNLPSDTCADCVSEAINIGWRLIDTAKNYANEEHVGRGIKNSGIDRKELFISSKLWLKDAGYEQAKKAFQLTLDRLQLSYLDLYLIHQPFGDVYGAWRALEELYHDGKIRAIGVSNFYDDRLVDFVMTNEVKPAVNQVEINPYHQQWKSQDVNQKYNVQLEAWGPLGQMKRPELLNEPVVNGIGKKYGKTPAQVILRWLIQRDIVTLVKTARRERMLENLDIFDFTSHPKIWNKSALWIRANPSLAITAIPNASNGSIPLQADRQKGVFHAQASIYESIRSRIGRGHARQNQSGLRAVKYRLGPCGPGDGRHSEHHSE